jgi:hypothetical protein
MRKRWAALPFSISIYIWFEFISQIWLEQLQQFPISPSHPWFLRKIEKNMSPTVFHLGFLFWERSQKQSEPAHISARSEPRIASPIATHRPPARRHFFPGAQSSFPCDSSERMACCD